MFAKIYRPSRNAMQSGQAKTRHWVLEFEPAMAKRPDPLMGWNSTGDTASQVKLKFDEKDQAVSYARKHGIPFRVTEKPEIVRKPKSYAANFSADRKEPWSH
ncbi:ETC complex I subunit [Hyphobacterium sp. HN65]|uniref:ETC complex I subunit n=1 Tax=Hyphobacterium lacteum TaxID=3116575 RepID=A0ABU7LM50_9PROT|nr:ETC complex I subunit [Hyphobacterium sp. HN65]MEE2524995.1 ETC complex I subunit [Hyphobacterium sp. HN65]